MAWHDPSCKLLELMWDDQALTCSNCGSTTRNRGSDAQKDLPPPPHIPVTQRSELQCIWPRKIEALSDTQATSIGDRASADADILPKVGKGLGIYSDLRHADEIRVICLFGTDSFDAPIHLALDTIDLFSWSRPTYEALSYTWADESGNSSRCERVYVGPNYDILPVTRNCKAALRRLRGKRDRIIWCDAVCINQESISERNHQVTLMPMIYSGASRTLVYLGETDEVGIKAMDFLSLESNIKGAGADVLDALASVYARPYFTRTWVVQEVAFSQDVTVTYGDRTLPWKLIKKGHKHLRSEHGDRSWIPRDDLIPVREIYNHPADDLFQLLKETRQCVAGDPRDKVFALLGIVRWKGKGTPAMQPDYSLSTQEIYTGTASFLLQLANKRREIMGYAVCPKKIPHLPSWVPDWTSCIDMKPSINLEFRLPSRYLSNISKEHMEPLFQWNVKDGVKYAGKETAHYLSTKEYTQLRDNMIRNNAETEIHLLRYQYQDLSRRFEESSSETYSRHLASDPVREYYIPREPDRGPIESLHGQYTKAYGPHPACNNSHALRWKSLFRYPADRPRSIEIDEKTSSLVVPSRLLLKIGIGGEVKIGQDETSMHYQEISDDTNLEQCEIHLVPSLGGLYMLRQLEDGIFSLVGQCNISITVPKTLKEMASYGKRSELPHVAYNSHRTDSCDCGKINKDTNDWFCFEAIFAYLNEYRLRQWDIDMEFLQKKGHEFREKERNEDLNEDHSSRPGASQTVGALFTYWFSRHATVEEDAIQPQLPEEPWDSDSCGQLQAMQQQTLDLVGPRDIDSFFPPTSSYHTDDLGGLRKELYEIIKEVDIRSVVRGNLTRRAADLWTTLAGKNEQETVAYFFEAIQGVKGRLKRHGSVLGVLQSFENYNWDGLWAPSRQGKFGKNRIFLSETVLPALERNLADPLQSWDINRVRICRWIITLDLLVDIQESLAMHTTLDKLCEAAQKETSILIY